MNKTATNLGRAALTGAVVVLGTFLLKVGLRLEDALNPVLWILLGGIALFGAILGVGGELAWRHLRESRLWILWAALCLAALSAPIVVPFIQETREQSAFLAGADSTRGVVESKMIRGGPRLWVTYTVAAQPHRVAAPRSFDWRYDRWERGDSVWVYYQGVAPDSGRVSRLGPPAVPVLRSLGWLWGVGGVLLLGYLPSVVALFREQRGKTAATPITGGSGA